MSSSLGKAEYFILWNVVDTQVIVGRLNDFENIILTGTNSTSPNLPKLLYETSVKSAFSFGQVLLTREVAVIDLLNQLNENRNKMWVLGDRGVCEVESEAGKTLLKPNIGPQMV